MTREEFQQLLFDDPALAKPLRKAVAAIPPRVVETFGTPTELATIAALLPVVSYIVKEIGLPWLSEAKRYSELWRQKFHHWIEDQYAEHGIHPYAVESSGNALRRELEAITDADARKSWERFAELLKPKQSTEDE